MVRPKGDTLVKTLIGITPPGAGEIRLKGTNIAGSSSAEIARLGIGYVAQRRGLLASMAVGQNLELGRVRGPTAHRGR